jgi:hypothetical protein
VGAAARGGTPPTYRLYIDGKWGDADVGKTYDIINPATEEEVARAPDASAADMARAIAAARRAFDEGPWRRTTPKERAGVIRRLIDALEKRKEQLRAVLVAAAAAEHPLDGRRRRVARDHFLHVELDVGHDRLATGSRELRAHRFHGRAHDEVGLVDEFVEFRRGDGSRRRTR